jgi:putative hydroxymethylpyrimidine transport system substrate-binding protein
VSIRWLGFLFVFLLMIGPGAVSQPLRLMLDFLPNPNHVPIYVALAKGLFAAAEDEDSLFSGIEVQVMIPAGPSDPVKLAAAGTVDVAITPQINFLIAKGSLLPLIAIGALIDHPLGGILSLSEYGINEMADLRGKRIGYSLTPLEPVLWRTMLAQVGVEPDEFTLVNVGFNTVLALVTHSVDAIGAFRNCEPIQVEILGGSPIFFPQEDYGVPYTYELLLVANEQLVRERADDLRTFLAALDKAIALTQAEPAEAFLSFVDTDPTRDSEVNRRAFAATLPLYADGLRHDDPEAWELMQAYLYEQGLIPRIFPLAELYTAELLPNR